LKLNEKHKPEKIKSKEKPVEKKKVLVPSILEFLNFNLLT
jgi:hypothetical protein